MLIRPKSARQESASPEANSLLRAIPGDEYARLVAEATTVQLRIRQDLIEVEEPIRHVWFPQSGMLSIVNDMQDEAASIEVGVIGREGMAGLPLVHGVESQPCRVIVQVAGDARRVPAEKFLLLLKTMPVLTAVLDRFTAALMNQASQQVACNRLHSLEQRCAKWLLTTHDHMESEELALTQEFLAVMLGVRRPGVTVAAQTLQDSGLIRYRRGRIVVTDRIGLEKISCECYRRIRADYEKILGDVMIPAATGPDARALHIA